MQLHWHTNDITPFAKLLACWKVADALVYHLPSQETSAIKRETAPAFLYTLFKVLLLFGINITFWPCVWLWG